jgi:hypothetical protein
VKKTDPKRRCKAHSRSGKQCGNAPIMGGMVCRMHGGSAPQVKRKAAERLADLIDPDRALRELARLAYSDPMELFNEQGKVLPITEWPAELRAAIGSFEVVRGNVDAGDGKFDDVIKVKLWDKPKALEMIAKHLGLLTERVEHSGGIAIKWQD